MDTKLNKVLYGEKDTFIVCRNSQGIEVRATPLRLTRYVVVFEAYNPYSLLQLSEVLSDFKIIMRDRLVYSGRAVVSNLVNTGFLLVCEASLEESWLDVDMFSAELQGRRLRAGFDEFIQQWQRMYKVTPEFKVAIADMQTFLTDLRHWLEQVELGIRSSPSADQVRMEREILLELGLATNPAISSLFERFEALPDRIDAELQPAHRVFARRQLHPLLLCSPFVYRTFQKPLGYAGDYEMVNMIARDPLEGSSLFAKAVNLWFLKQPPAEAHRNRIDYLRDRLEEETRRALAKAHHARVINLGCGPAIEVQRFLEEEELSNCASFTLMDFNEETLVHTRSELAQICKQRQRCTPIQLIKKSVHQILKEAGKVIDRSPDEQYDFVYCAGLFDYLSDQVCQRLMNVLFSWVRPGGLLVATNVDGSNPSRHTMEYVLEWHLTYRDSAEFARLLPEEAPAGSFAVKSDPTGVNIYLEVRKPAGE
jgi:extracellular factor (EF) 3-hydroxypalmitic acid methyl ester biosynthesis protein